MQRLRFFLQGTTVPLLVLIAWGGECSGWFVFCRCTAQPDSCGRQMVVLPDAHGLVDG